MKRHLILFVRNPELGKVKTRLAATVGPERAFEVYERLLRITRSAALGFEGRRHLFYSGKTDMDDEWDNAHFEKRAQMGADLGERMSNAFEIVLGNDSGKAVIIGSDCPEMSTEVLEEAFRALDASDVVLGPATDGGYYLLGMRRFVPELFRDKQWSTPSVLTDTLSDAQRLGLSVRLLPALSDLDDEADLIRSGL